MGRISSIAHNSVTVFFVLGESLSFTYVANELERRLEVHFSTLIIDHCSRPLGHQDQAYINNIYKYIFTKLNNST